MDPAAGRLLALFEAAVSRAAPAVCLPAHLPPRPRGRTVVVGAGKAGAAMARVVEETWDGPLTGLVVTRYGHGAPCRRIEIVEAAHPIPDAVGYRAAGRILELVSGLGPDDLVLCLVSGGGSALMSLPAPGLTLADKQAVGEALVWSGAAIDEINAVRKHLSAIKGGRLAAAAYPAETVTLAISDVPGDDPAVIASGPTVADPSRFADARAVLARYAIEAPAAVRAHLSAAAEETPKPGDARLARARTVLVATPAEALAAAAQQAETLGLAPIVLGDRIEGEAREVGRAHAALARAARPQGRPRGAVVGRRDHGHGHRHGGRRAQRRIPARPRPRALTARTASMRSPAIPTASTAPRTMPARSSARTSLARARAAGLDGAAHLARNDSYGFFNALDDLVMTGPTRTNVNDFRAILIEPGPG